MRKTIDIKGLSIDLINEWHGVFKPKYFNWVDFHLTDIHIEFDRVHGVFELEFILLGFGFRLYWIYNKKLNEQSMKKYEKILKEGGFTI